jgi:hypothetical protein
MFIHLRSPFMHFLTCQFSSPVACWWLPSNIHKRSSLTDITVLQYGYAFHASSCTSREPFGASSLINEGTLLPIKTRNSSLVIHIKHNVILKVHHTRNLNLTKPIPGLKHPCLSIPTAHPLHLVHNHAHLTHRIHTPNIAFDLDFIILASFDNYQWSRYQQDLGWYELYAYYTV